MEFDAQLEAARTAGQAQAVAIYAAEIVERFPGTDEAKKLATELPALRAAAEAGREAERLAGLWTYHEVDTGHGIQYSAYIYGQSDAADAPALRLVLRRHPDWGQNSYLLVGDGADFACTGSCQAQLAFDGGEPQPFEISRAKDADPPAVFIEDDKTVFARVEASKTLTLGLPLAGDRRVEYRFELGGYDPARIQPSGG